MRRLVVLTLAVGLACAGAACGGRDRGDDGGGYTPERRASFVAACAAGTSTEVCRCFYDRLAATLPYTRFAAIDRQIRRDPRAIPDDVAALAAACAGEHAPGG